VKLLTTYIILTTKIRLHTLLTLTSLMMTVFIGTSWLYTNVEKSLKAALHSLNMSLFGLIDNFVACVLPFYTILKRLKLTISKLLI